MTGKSISLTDRQREVLSFISAYRRRTGLSPTMLEIASHFGMKTPGVDYHVRVLEKKGMIRRGHGARQITVLHPSPKPILRFPIIGSISKSGIFTKECDRACTQQIHR